MCRMLVTLTIVRYPGKFIPFAFLSMAIFRLPLFFKKRIAFFKLMGSGKNGTFDKQPDLQQWALLAVHRNDKIPQSLYGRFIDKWWQRFGCEIFTIFLEPLEGHGSWDGKKLFDGIKNDGHTGVTATLTRATINVGKLSYFWKNVAPVANKMRSAEGFIMSLGIGEIPWIKQATFSVWQKKADMLAFAYQMKEHAEVIKMTRRQKWYKEEMFVRFRIIATKGTIRGENPLKEKL